MSSSVECVVGGLVYGEKALRRCRRLKALHPPFSASRVHMRPFNPVVLPTRLMVSRREAEKADGAHIGLEPIGDERFRCAAGLSQELAHESKRGALVATRLDENV